MWEQIRANRIKSVFLVGGMAALLVLIGYFLGEAFLGSAIGGVVIALAILVVMNLVAFFQGDNIMLALSRAKKIKREDHPRLYNIVEEMKIASGLEKMPDIYIIDDPSLNAFATGRDVNKASVAVTSGLLQKLSRDELQGVIGHEIAHIKNRDVLLMTLSGVLLGTIVILSWYKREYMADASSAVFTRYPEGLASALEKLSASTVPVKAANQATAPMYIINPFRNKGRAAADLTSTHPPISERIRILRSMGGGASLGDYNTAYSTVHKGGRNILGKATMAGTGAVGIRAAASTAPLTATVVPGSGYRPNLSQTAYGVRTVDGHTTSGDGKLQDKTPAIVVIYTGIPVVVSHKTGISGFHFMFQRLYN